jgi:hypothetical protein
MQLTPAPSFDLREQHANEGLTSDEMGVLSVASMHVRSIESARHG